MNFICLYRRGPNKYDRNWEDENAYSKPTRGTRGGVRGAGRGKASSPGLEELEVQDEEQFPALSSAPPRKGAPRGRGRGGTPNKDVEYHRQQYSNQKFTESSPVANSATSPKPVSPTAPPAPTNQPTRGGRGGRGTSNTGRPNRGGSGRFVESRGRGRGQATNEKYERKTYVSRDDPREMQEEDGHLESNLKNLSIKDTEPVMSRDFRRQPQNSKNTISLMIYLISLLQVVKWLFLLYRKCSKLSSE